MLATREGQPAKIAEQFKFPVILVPYKLVDLALAHEGVVYLLSCEILIPFPHFREIDDGQAFVFVGNEKEFCRIPNLQISNWLKYG